LTESGKVKGFYALQIKDFSAELFRPIFEKYISKEAQVTTNEWKWYRPLEQDYSVTEIPSKFGIN
jgi:hypothetical protein